MGRNRIKGLALCTLKFGFDASVRPHGARDVLCLMFASPTCLTQKTGEHPAAISLPAPRADIGSIAPQHRTCVSCNTRHRSQRSLRTTVRKQQEVLSVSSGGANLPKRRALMAGLTIPERLPGTHVSDSIGHASALSARRRAKTY
jgi:hypothetical protein